MATERSDVDREKGSVKPGHLPVSEVLFSRAGAASPFGDEVNLPLPLDEVDYEMPEETANKGY